MVNPVCKSLYAREECIKVLCIQVKTKRQNMYRVSSASEKYVVFMCLYSISDKSHIKTSVDIPLLHGSHSKDAQKQHEKVLRMLGFEFSELT